MHFQSTCPGVTELKKEATIIENQHKLRTNLQEHKGPCQTVGQLIVGLTNWKSDSSKTGIWNLTNFLNVKDKKLIMATIGWQKLKTNWCIVTNTCNYNLIYGTSNTVQLFDLDQIKEINFNWI